jgi:hypothetical protein
VKVGVGVLVRVCVGVGVLVYVGVTVDVLVDVGVFVLVTVKVGELGFTVGVAVRVGETVKVGVQQSTSSSVQFDAIFAMLGPPIRAWLDMGKQPVTLPHQVNEPEVMETLFRFHCTFGLA